MKSKFKKATLLLTGIMVGGKLFAQTTPDTAGTKMMNSDYVQPFSNGGFRTFSIGFEGGVLTPYTIFGPNKQDYRSPHEEVGYGGFIKEQILPSFGIQADFLKGKVDGAVTADDQSDGTYTSFNTKVNYSFDLVGNFTLANINWRYNRTFIQPYFTLGGGVIDYTAAVTTAAGTVIQPKHNEFYLPVRCRFENRPG